MIFLTGGLVVEHIKYEQQGKIVVISIDRPQKLNALSLSTMRELAACWEKFKTEIEVVNLEKQIYYNRRRKILIVMRSIC